MHECPLTECKKPNKTAPPCAKTYKTATQDKLLPISPFAVTFTQAHHVPLARLQKLNHAPLDRLRRIAREPLFNSPNPSIFQGIEEITCSACQEGSQPQASHKSNPQHTDHAGHTISSDKIGPISLPSFSGKLYVITVVDVASRFCISIPLHTRA